MSIIGDGNYEGRESWWDRWGVRLVVGLFVAIIVVAMASVVYGEFRDRRRATALEAALEFRCSQARLEILDCLKRDPEGGWSHCHEEAQIRYMCMRWPESWEGKR